MNSFGLARSQFHPALPHYDCAGTVFDILTVGPHNIEQKTELSIHCRPREMVKMAKLWDAQVGCAGSSFCVGGVKVASLAQRHHRQSIGILLTSRCRLESCCESTLVLCVPANGRFQTRDPPLCIAVQACPTAFCDSPDAKSINGTWHLDGAFACDGASHKRAPRQTEHDHKYVWSNPWLKAAVLLMVVLE